MIGNWINTMFQTIMLWIDSVVYWFAAQIYELFIRLATIQLFSDSFFQNFASRIYSILGVFMLFYLAYALLNAIIDPDKLAKGDKSVSKIASNLVVSLVILGLLPSIFSYAYRLQNYILASNTIGAIIFGGETVDPSSGEENDTMLQYGNYLSFSVLNTFLNPDNYNVRIDANPDTSWINVRDDIIDRGEYGGLTGLSEAIVHGAPDLNDGNQEKYVTYRVVLSTLAGVYLCYVLISFTLDLGVRVVKFAFCQLIAPIPVIMRIVPGKKGTFDKWMKLTLTVYFEVFIRVAFMYLSIYLISEIARTNVLGEVFSGGIQGMLAFAIIILGILTFAKQAPKMLGDMLGLDSGSLKLGIGEKLKGNVVGKGIAGVGAATLGFVTGGIGGAAVGLANGAGFSAAAFGAMNGWKNKGMQLNKQRQNVYSAMGLKGKAGWFGGQAYFDSLADKEKKAVKENYIKGREHQVEKFENSKLFESKMKEYENAQLKDNRERLTAAENKYNNAKKKYDANVANRSAYERSSEYQGILARFQNQAINEAETYMKQHLHDYSATEEGRRKYQQDKEALIQSYQMKHAHDELQRLSQNGTITDAAQSYLNSIQNFNDDLKELNDAAAILNEAKTHVNDIDKATARTKTLDFMADKENADLDQSIKKYQSNLKAVNDANKEKELKKYLESDAGREAIATQKEAFAALEKETKAKGGPPPDKK